MSTNMTEKNSLSFPQIFQNIFLIIRSYFKIILEYNLNFG